MGQGLTIWKWINVVSALSVIILNALAFIQGTKFLAQALVYIFVYLLIMIGFVTGKIDEEQTSKHLSYVASFCIFINII